MDKPTLNATAASLLGFLHEGPQSGWDLAATAETVIGDFWSLTRSQVYRELSRMADAGLVEAGQRERRDRRPYRLTEAGRQAFADWIDQPPDRELIRFPLLLTISFGRHLPPDRLQTFIAEHREAHEQRLAEYEEQREAADQAPDADPYALVTLEFGLAYERAALAWFDRLSDLLPGMGDAAS